MKRAGIDRFIAAVLAVVALAHVGLVLLLPNLEEKFQLGDRAWDRAAKIDAVMAAKDWNGVIEALFYHSSPGDYVFFLPAYAAFGAPGVIAQNIILLLLGTYFLYRIGREFFSPLVARVATIAYCLLPSTLFHPQAFVTESLCNPLLIIAAYFALRMLTWDRPVVRDAVIFAGIAAIICFARNMFVLLPFAIAVLVLIHAASWRSALRRTTAMIAISLSLVALWQVALWANDGRYEVAPSFHGLSSNLFLRADRMARMGGFELPDEVTESRAMSASAFVGLTMDHPRSFARSALSDAVNLVANTGVSMAYGRYLGLFDLKEDSDQDTFKWRDIRDTQGTFAMVVYMWQTSPAALVLNLTFTLAWGLVLLIALYGVIRHLLETARPIAQRLLLPGIALYVFVFSFAAGSIRWDHRSPAEFIICLFFAHGVWLLVRAWRSARTMGLANPAHVAPAEGPSA